MIVKELIDVLNKCPMDAKVVVNDPDWNGFETDDFQECIDVKLIKASQGSGWLEHYFSLDDDGETVVYLKDDREKDTSDEYDDYE